MNYHLRNQDKIEKEYGTEILERIVDSLDMHFKINMILRDLIEVKGEPYPIFIISDVRHSVNDIVFYRIKFENGVHKIAFKEFVG